MTALSHPLTWASPRPLWRVAATPGRAPTILRFASDEFMEQLIGILAADPARLADHVARYETWRTPPGKMATSDLVERVPLPGPIRQRRLLSRLSRAPAPAEPPDPDAEPDPPLKLYQPGHQRYYIAAATLACAIPGLPDRRLAGGHEQVGFVLRRLMPAAADAAVGAPLFEYGFVKDSAGARWQRVSSADERVLVPGEERLPAFPLAHQDGRGVRRTMWGGLIPVGRREEYMSAPVTRTATTLAEGQQAALSVPVPPSPRPSKLARTTEFKLDFAEGWKGLIEAATKAAKAIREDTGDGSTPENKQDQIRTLNLQYQMQSWLLLLDMMAFFERHLKSVAAQIRLGSLGTLDGAKRDLYNWLATDMPVADGDGLQRGFLKHGAPLSDTLSHELNLAAALRVAEAGGAKLEAVTTLYTDSGGAERDLWPTSHYLLAGIASDGLGANIFAHGVFELLPPADGGEPPLESDVVDLTKPLSKPPDPDPPGDEPAPLFDLNRVDKLTVLVARALDGGDESEARALPFAQQLAQTMQGTFGDTNQFRLRYVHLNADCGPIHPPTLSEPSEAFELAHFFDSDAPARPVRITLPMDTSPAGLRKHARGTAFVLSDMLCGQVQRAKGLGFVDLVRQVLPWPLHKDIKMGGGGGCKSGSTDIGMICSLSIPIVTLCALILLMIIVSLLDFIFRWLPWLMFCFPVPGLKGKKKT